MPKVNDNYVKSSVMFPSGNTYSIGKVIRQKLDASVNYVGRRKNNPILYMQKYCVEFYDGEVNKLK